MVANPFELSELTSIRNTSLSFPEIVFNNVSVLESTGKNQFDSFFWDRLVNEKVAIDVKISKNKFVLPGSTDPSSTKKENAKSMAIKDDTINKLRSALEYREKETKVVFKK